MSRLTGPDLRAGLQFVREAYAVRDLEAFRSGIAAEFHRVVPCDRVSYNEIDLPAARNDLRSDPQIRQEVVQSLRRRMSAHPLITHYARTADPRPLKISDFLTDAEFRRLPLYTDGYRLLGVEYQMAFILPPASPLLIGIAFSRHGSDFTEKDRELLEVLRPHAIEAYRNAEMVSAMHRDLALVGHGIDELEAGVIVLTRKGRPRFTSAHARGWLTEYFEPRVRDDQLPDVIRRWIRSEDERLGVRDELPVPRRAMIVERNGKRLVIRLLTDQDHRLLLLQEETSVEPARLERLGLTRREAEVLAWIAHGKTNAEIATMLGARPRTVGKHLERIYAKLGVETRTAAAKIALTPPRAE